MTVSEYLAEKNAKVASGMPASPFAKKTAAEKKANRGAPKSRNGDGGYAREHAKKFDWSQLGNDTVGNV